MFAVTTAAVTARRQWLKSLGLLAACPSRVPTLSAYAYQRSVSLLLARLPDDLKARHPEIAWKDMAGAGNIYRHDYEDVAAQHVWEAVQIDLPPLRAVIEQELRAPGEI